MRARVLTRAGVVPRRKMVVKELRSSVDSLMCCAVLAMLEEYNEKAYLSIDYPDKVLALVLGHVAMFGVVREADENAATHIFQLLMAGQIPVIAFFAIKWLPRTPRQALLVLALQGIAALAALAPVFFLNL